MIPALLVGLRHCTALLTHLRDAVLHDLLARQIGLVADEKLVHALRRIPVNLLQPLLDVREGVCGERGKRLSAVRPCPSGLERTVIGHVVNDDDAVCATVVRRGDSTETFLAYRKRQVHATQKVDCTHRRYPTTLR